MITFLSALPIIIILVLMVGFRWGGSKAGIAGWLMSLIVASFTFKVNAQTLFWAQINGIFRAANVLYIIWGALLFFRITEADGTLKSTSTFLQNLTHSRELQVLLLAWGFTSFLQGVGGFGVPIAVVAPILVTMDFTALQAVVMASLGHAWAISFGSLGASYEALISATGMAGTEMSSWMALYLGLVCFLVGFAVLWVAGGKIMLRRGIVYLLSMAVVMVTVQYIAAVSGLGNIAAMLGAVGGIFTGILWTFRRNTQPLRQTHIKEPTTIRNYNFLIPYVVLIFIIFGINFINPLHDIVNKVIIQVAIPELIAPDHSVIPATKTKGLSLFGHAGAVLIYAAIITLVLAVRKGRLPPGSGSKIRQGVVRSGVKSTVGILAMMAMATTMQIAGMVNQLSTTMANLSGQFYPFVAPFIGALGAFMTGSNTNSNVLFGAFQQAVAQSLNLYVPLVLAIHNAGAAVGSIFAPAKIIVGCSTVGLSGQESEALRISTQFGLLIVLIIAFVGMISTQFIQAPM